MGSGAKIALVALLILMVVAVAKFVQNGSDEAAQNAAAKKESAGPRLSTPSTAAGAPNLTKRAPISSRTSPQTPPALGQPAAKAASPAAAEPKPAPRPESPVAQASPTAPGAPARPAATPAAPPASFPAPVPPRSPEAERPSASPGSEGVVARAAPPANPGGSIHRDIAPEAAQGPSSGPRPQGPEPEPRAPSRETTMPPAVTAPSPLASSFPQDYKVESGDSYWKIAERFYGTGKGKHYKAITSANSNINLVPGKTIKIPAPPAETAPPAPSGVAARSVRAPAAPSNPEAEFEYLVQRGDNLTGIARRFNRTLRQIESANPSLQYQTLRAGAKIVIPKKVNS